MEGQKQAIMLCKEWISSWFDEPESHDEFKDSLHKFELYLESSKDVIGNHYFSEIAYIKNTVVTNIHHTGNHEFMKRCTLNVKGSSSVEAANGPLKSGKNAAKSNMNLATSAHAQTLQAKTKQKKKSVSLSKRMRSYSTFSRSLTRNLITDYADLRVCKLCDNSHKVTSIYIGNGVWHCISTQVLNDFMTQTGLVNVNSKPQYVNIRTVRIEGKYMTCTCNDIFFFQSPCIHIASILKETIGITPNMIPIRWWYHFLYYHKSEASKAAPKVAVAVNQLLQSYRKHSFTQDNLFKGIDISTSSFDLTKYNVIMNTDSKYIAIQLMLSFIAENKVLQIRSKEYRNLWHTKSVVRLSDKKQVLTSIGFGGTSSTFGHLSQSCVDEEDSHASDSHASDSHASDSHASEDISMENSDNNTHISFNDIISKATEAAYACKDDEQKAELFTMLCNFMNKFDVSKRDASFLGSELSRFSKGHEPRKQRQNDT